MPRPVLEASATSHERRCDAGLTSRCFRIRRWVYVSFVGGCAGSVIVMDMYSSGSSTGRGLADGFEES